MNILPTSTQPYRASLSTMWAIQNFDHLEDFFIAAGQYGYDKIELNHQISPAMLEGIDLERYRFSSVHEPCPTALSTDELKSRDWQISSPDEQNRARGVESIKRSIDLAHQLNAPVVVVHGGQIPDPLNRERQLRRLYRAGQKDSEAYAALKREMTAEREAASGPHLEAVKRSLASLLDYAAPLKVRLGLENRFHYMDIPSPDEMAQLLALGAPEALGFWLDTGHALVLERLGLFAQAEWLERFSGRIVGIHLHDVTGIDDHGAPGFGEANFDHLCGYVPKHAIRTFEVKPSVPAAQLQESLRLMTQKGCL